MVTAKGKGSLQTYFLNIHARSERSYGEERKIPTPDPSDVIIPEDKGKLDLPQDTKESRLISWNVENLSQTIRRIVARRAAAAVEKTGSANRDFNNQGMPLDELATIIKMPKLLDVSVIKRQVDPESIELDEEVTSQLRELVTEIARGYHDNPFHNFEHASRKLFHY